ncbi:MAG: serine/threonine protein kinase, partial [Polyangia bacterium]
GFDGKPLGFVHRDVSPHNIFLTFEGHTKVIDFGIAKARDSSLETKTGVLKGRANYMAPEQLTRRADRRSDIFSVGAVLFEVLSGRRLWQGMGEIEILAALTRGEIPSLSAVRPETPATLVQICERALAPRVEDRFDTAAEMRDALDQHLWATGGAPRHRDISDALLREFDAERQRVRAIIEAALFRLQAGESGRLEAIEVRDPRESINDSRRSSMTGSPVSAFAGERSRHGAPSLHTASSVRHTPSRVQHTPSRVQHTPSALRDLPGVSLSSVVRAGATLPPATHELLEPLDSPSFLTRVWRGQPWLVGTAFAAVFIATTMAVGLHHPVPPPPEPIAPPAAVPAPMAVPKPAAPETIVFSVSVTPSTAQISIDGQAIPSNPFLGHFAKSGGTHRVRATAPGHQAKERLVSFDDNVMIDLSLTPTPTPAPPPAPPAHVSSSNEHTQSRHWDSRHSDITVRHDPPPPQKAPASIATPSLAPAPVAEKPRRDPNDIVPRGEWEPPRKRTIDTSNPYGEDK